MHIYSSALALHFKVSLL